MNSFKSYIIEKLKISKNMELPDDLDSIKSLDSLFNYIQAKDIEEFTTGPAGDIYSFTNEDISNSIKHFNSLILGPLAKSESKNKIFVSQNFSNHGSQNGTELLNINIYFDKRECMNIAIQAEDILISDLCHTKMPPTKINNEEDYFRVLRLTAKIFDKLKNA